MTVTQTAAIVKLCSHECNEVSIEARYLQQQTISAIGNYMIEHLEIRNLAQMTNLSAAPSTTFKS
jgi:hypothetical protein